METRAEWVDHAEHRVGISRDEALRRVEHDDLWLLHPEARYVGSVEEWEEAQRILMDAADLLAHASLAARALVEDAIARAEVLAERER